MEYLNTIIKLLKENKWSSIFILFAILVAYSIGKQYAKNQTQEDFMDDLDAYADKKPPVKELPKKEKKKKIIASASCPEMPDLNKYMLKTESPDLKDYVHKSLVPDLKNYLSKPFIRKNFVSKTKLNEELRQLVDPINTLYDYMKESKTGSFWALTASSKDDIKAYSAEFKNHYTFYNMDAIPLKSMVRSNPGLILLKNNVVVKKWGAFNFPDPTILKKYIHQ